MKTFVRWQGNKSNHLNKFIQYVPEFSGTYIEPFLGSGALFLKLQPEKWIVNDLNKDLINIWNQVKDNPKAIIKEFKEFAKIFIPLSKKEKISYCREITSMIETLPYDLKRACVYMLMKHSSYRGELIVKNRFYFEGVSLDILSKNRCYFLESNTYNNLLAVSDFLNKTQGKITNKSYENVLSKAKEGDFVFLDPPYIEAHDYGFNYNKDQVLDSSFIKRLYTEVKKLDKKGVKWMMTQANTDQIRTTFKEYMVKTFRVYRISSKSYTNELVIMNY